MRALLSRIRPGLVYALFILLGSALQFDGYFLGLMVYKRTFC